MRGRAEGYTRVAMPSLTEAEKERMRTLRAQGVSIKALAIRFEVSYNTAQQALKVAEQNIKDRRRNAKTGGRGGGVVNPTRRAGDWDSAGTGLDIEIE